MSEKSKITGYCTITYKMRLYTNHLKYLEQTKKLYNEVILIYYKLLLDNIEILNLSNQYALRELEILTVPNKEGKKPENYIDLDLPTYFRRSAINQAIGAVRNYRALYERFSKDETGKLKEPSIAKSFNTSPLFYKGMYKNLIRKSNRAKALEWQ